MINVTEPLSTPLMLTKKKKKLTEEILEEISEKFMEKILDIANQNEQDAVKKFNKTKDIQKQINELRETSTNTKVKERTL
jgi:histone H3/H4